MQITVTISGAELSAPTAARQLRLIADMVKKGVTQSHGSNIEYMGEFAFEVDFEGEPEHQDYWDGEGNHIHVSEEGFIISRQGPDKPDGTPDREEFEGAVLLSDWAKAHGGITPFGPEEGGGHVH